MSVVDMSPVISSRQLGASLIEFMVASTVGIIAIGIIGTVLVLGQRVATERTKELTLLQSSNSVLQMMKLDMHRAGYNGISSHQVKLSGADHLYYVENSATTGLLAYAYVSAVSGGSYTYTNVVYEQTSSASNVLRICEKKQSTVMSVLEARNFPGMIGHNCNTLFHKERILVDKFNVSLLALPGAKVSSALVTVELDTSLKNTPSMTQSLSFQVKQRNW
jgi:type IV pilus assembly protein PilW